MSYLCIHKESPWIYISLNRPSKKNALHLALIQELSQVLLDLQNTQPIQGIVLQGEGSCFCSGADLSWISQAPSEELEQLFDLFQLLSNYPSPVIAYAHGFVFGGGMGLLSVCDFVSAHKQTQFCFSEVKLGLMPALIAPFILKNHPRLKEYLLTASSFGVDTALNSGFINMSGSESECRTWQNKLIQNLNTVHLKAFQETKAFLKKIQTLPTDHIKSKAVKSLIQRRKDPLVQEKLSRFIHSTKSSNK